MQKLILIDGNAIIHRAFHAIPPFKTSQGLQVNAIYGFASILLNILNREKPDYIAVAFDLKGPTFRHLEYKEYKATRVKAPDELYAQIPSIHEIVTAFQIPIYTKEGFEADDVLGTLAKQAELGLRAAGSQRPEQKDLSTYIVTGDLDTLQLVSEKTRILANTQKFSEPLIYDLAKVMSRCGLTPSQIADMKGLQGDNSDNIKGVAGIGPKTARTLLQQYGSLENIYANIDEIKGGVHDKLVRDKENAFKSKHLATIITDVDVTLDLSACKTHDYDEAVLRAIFAKFEFNSLINRLNLFHKISHEKKVAESNLQASLF